MTPKEKAVELADIYFEIVKDIDWRKTNSPPMFMAHVKKCALIAVDDILNNFGTLTEGKQHYAAYSTIKFYEEVKQEIRNL